ncbi:MAG TPA: GNAT family N-acetyltransferase [Aggregatilineaceae bacterium]|nr:GNAT family N-acetyltransferase [Aggregatilineaceae bacterium]
MLSIVQAEAEQDSAIVRELFWEYLEWANGMVHREFGVTFDIEAMLAGDMADLNKFLPPSGRLLLARDNGQLAGIACLRRLRDDLGEVKRMYVRPAFRRQAIGRALLQRLLDEAHYIGYTRMRLDSARFMTAAHALYRSVGFQEIEAYPESEIPASFQSNWIFMERSL